MANSTQTVVSDGSLALLDISFDYLFRSEITVYFDSVLTVNWAWVGVSDKQITFDPVVPAGVTVLVKRTTSIAALLHEFSLGAAFTATSLDQDLKQVLHIAQEASEANFSGEFFADIDMHNFRVRNIGTAVDGTDALSLAQYQADALGAYQSKLDAAASAAAAAQSANDAVTQTNGVLRTGDTMTGPLALAGDATLALQATTKQQLDAGLATKQASNVNLTAEAGLTGAADKLAYYYGLGAKALTNLFAWGRSFLGAADVAAARTVLELSTVAQAEAEAGAATTTRAWTAERVAQAIAALAKSVGVGQTWQDVSASRAIGTPFTNSTGGPIEVALNIDISSGVCRFTVGGVVIAESVSGSRFNETFTVPNGATYLVTQVSGSIYVAHWAELR